MSERKTPPNQPTYIDKNGTTRFQSNPIVEYLLEVAPVDLNDLSITGFTSEWTNDDWAQFAQLIGYSVSGWGGLSYVVGSGKEALVEAGDVSSVEEAHALGYQEGIQAAEEAFEMALYDLKEGLT